MTWLIVGAAFVTVFFLVFALTPARTSIYSRKKKRDATNLPSAVGAVVGVMPSISVPASRRTKLAQILKDSDNPWGVSVGELQALSVLSAAVTAVAGALLGGLVGPLYGLSTGLAPVFAVLGAVLGFILPANRLRSAVKRRHRRVSGTLYEALDLFSMATSTGSPVPVAVAKTYHYLPEGDLRNELGQVVRAIHAGESFEEAIDAFAERNNTKRVTTFARTLKDANRDGQDRTEKLRREAGAIRRDQAKRIKARGKTIQLLLIPTILVAALGLGLLAWMFPFLYANDIGGVL